ncbi:LEF-3 [Urbanus proteus nucleopolyhedrovirus]|uniref:LEF-3 n=1 Tax=Urbanus proteus nucleopolyhedrovirus TaxID=1675866 RepID=A0A161CCY1_9ABAC|nr:LEF-3 [Urbanus proteus nucleopolyhedrovirus]AKR17301.2 LEF-3 [Urbanus proteus nucleopolyhedrovirus]
MSMIENCNNGEGGTKRKIQNETQDRNERQIKQFKKSDNRKFLKTTGELIMKCNININNEPFYLFRFLTHLGSKEYYGDVGTFQSIQENVIYDVNIVMEKSKLYIASYKKADAPLVTVDTKKVLSQKNFEAGDNVAVLAKLQYIFKPVESNMYKLVFLIKFCDKNDKIIDVQVECSASLNSIVQSVKKVSLQNENDVLNYFNKKLMNDVILYRIQCQTMINNNTKYYSLNFQQMSEIKFDTNGLILDLNVDDFENIKNISRSNKSIVCKDISNITATQHSSSNNNVRFQIIMKVKDDNDPENSIRTVYFFNNNFNKTETPEKTKNETAKIEKLLMDINQLNDLMEFIDVKVYCTYDTYNYNYNVLSIIKYDRDETYYVIN